MTLQELLDELKLNILHDRSDRVDGTPDYLWSDETLIRYIDQAYRRFARRALCIRDNTMSVTLQAGVSEYTLDASVLGIISAKYTGDVADLARAGHAQLDTYHMPDPYFFDPSQLSSMPPGKPLAYATDETIGLDDNDSTSAIVMRIFPVPSADYVQPVKLRVVRMPLEHLTSANMSAVPEIPEDHHLEILDWAAYLALRIVDVDGGMPALADKFKATFEESVALARNNTMRKLFTPLQWGFGRNAFSWER